MAPWQSEYYVNLSRCAPFSVAIERFSMPAEQNGMMLSYIGAVSLFMQGAGIAVATRLLSERAAMIASTVVLTLSYYVLVRKDANRMPGLGIIHKSLNGWVQ